MRLLNFCTYWLPFIITLIVTSCVKVDDYEVPSPKQQSVSIEGTHITIEALRDALVQEITNNGNSILTLESDNYISGYVVSSDEYGNFFEEIIVQNAATEANRGVRVRIDANPLFTSYEFGRKVFVKLKGLSLGFENGVLTLGMREGNRIESIAESRMFNTVIRDTIVSEIIPTTRSISELSTEVTNTFIRLEDVQFTRHDVLDGEPLTYAGEPGDEFNGERLLESCSEDANIILSTSTFADFKSATLPKGSGFIDGIFTFNFFGEEFNLVVNDILAVQLNNPERCDPLELDCGVAPVNGSLILFSEFFETQTVGDPIAGNGWTNYIEKGTQTWEAYFDDGPNASLGISARMGSFGSGDPSSIGWLITPAIDFNEHNGETLIFKTSNSFADNSCLEVLFSDNWNGNPATLAEATWYILASAVIVEDDDFFGDWISSGRVDLSCISGTGNIAWKYIGSGDKENDGTFELDEIEIRSD